MNSIQNQKGFISLYAILIFMIILVFVTMCTYQLRVHAMMRQSQDLHYTEVYILQYVQHKMMEENESSPLEEQDESTIQEEEIQHSEETLRFQQTAITLQYEEKKILATYIIQEHTYHMEIQLDEENHIFAVAYS